MADRREPRKRPSTRSGAEIVDAILDAAEALIDELGLGRFTTNAVVERAGVSVGSLYQYFPNKDAILVALARRLERRTSEQLIAALEGASGEPLEVAAQRCVDVLLSGIGGLTFRRALLHEVPPGRALDASAPVDATIAERLRAELARRDDVRPGPHVLMAMVIGHAIEGVIEAVVREHPALVELPMFRAELNELVLRYLRR